MSKFRLDSGTNSTLTLPSGTTVQMDGFPATVQITHWSNTGGRFRSFKSPADEDSSPQFRAALEEAGIYEQETIHVDAPPAMFRGAGAPPRGPDRVLIHPKAPAEPGAAQVVLYQDESGGVSWHFADPPLEAEHRLRGGSGVGGATFTIPTRNVAAQQALEENRVGPRLRGPVTKWGRKIFKVLVLPALGAITGPVVEAIVGAVERKHRQELIRSLTPKNYRVQVKEPFADWQALAGGRALLVVHGIFSTTEGVLAQFPEAAMRELAAHYDNRMIAFDQRTVSRSPVENVQFFLETLQREAPGQRFEFDILCHSRGGIVARTLAERGADVVPGHACKFNKVYFVATPNNGSVLGDPAHMVDMIDVFTNLLTLFPDGPVLYSIEVILAIVKLIAFSAERNLPGLAAMGTKGYIQDTLNRAREKSPAEYAAATSNYAPDPKASNGFLVGRFGTAAIDRIFADARGAVANDLVVPTEGVFGDNGHPSFPITRTLQFDQDDHVWHTGFFAQPRVWEAIKGHFQLPGAPAALESTTASQEIGQGVGGPSGGWEEPVRRPRFRGESVSVSGWEQPRQRPQESTNVSRSVELEPTELRRNPHIKFHELVLEGQMNPLWVSLQDITGAMGPETITALLEPGAVQVEVEVKMRAPGFTITAPGSTKLVLKPVREAALEETVFNVTAQSPGLEPRTRELRAEFWQDNTCLGSVCHHTKVVPANWTQGVSGDGQETAVGFQLRAPREQCDLCISVQGEDEEGMPPFRMNLRCIVPGAEFGDLYVGKLNVVDSKLSLDEYLSQFYADQFNQLPGAGLSDAAFAKAFREWQQMFNSALNDLGRTLWTWLPPRFKEKYFSLYQQGVQVRSILINSDEMSFPWELVVPHGALADGTRVDLPPLGRQHIIGRWRPGEVMRPQPQRFRVKSFCVLNPEYPSPDDLPSTRREVEQLKALFPAVTVITPADLPTVERDLLGRNDVNVFHFSGHGEYNGANADLSTLRLPTGKINAMKMNGAHFLASGSPIIYLNACHAGAGGRVVGRAGGFSSNLLKGGSSGVIAPYWPVDDERAADFAVGLYTKLLNERSIGEALQELREEHPDDPTYRAFAYLGDPWTRLDFSALR